jgi:hypothetical protein
MVTPGSNVSSYLDLPAAIDYFLATEVTKNPDGYRGSIKMSKDKQKPIAMGPVWVSGGAVTVGGCGCWWVCLWFGGQVVVWRHGCCCSCQHNNMGAPGSGSSHGMCNPGNHPTVVLTPLQHT